MASLRIRTLPAAPAANVCRPSTTHFPPPERWSTVYVVVPPVSGGEVDAGAGHQVALVRRVHEHPAAVRAAVVGNEAADGAAAAVDGAEPGAEDHGNVVLGEQVREDLGGNVRFEGLTCSSG